MNRTPWLLLALVVVTWMASSMLADDSGAEARADLYARAADSIAVVRDSIARENAVQAQAYADSSRLWSFRMADAQDRAIAAAARAQGATLRASAVATDLAARLDSTSTALFVEYQTEVAARDSAHMDELEAVRDQLVTVTADRDALVLVVSGLRAEVAAGGQQIQALAAANAALRDALAAKNRKAWGATALAGAATVCALTQCIGRIG